MRFGQAFGDAWPYDEDIAGFTPKEDWKTPGLTGWQVPINPVASIYRDTPPYRLTYDDFVQYAGKLKESRSRPGVTYGDHQIVMGTTANTNVHPIHVDFFLEQLKPTNKPNEPIAHAASVDDYVIDPSLYYWKQDTFLKGYKFPMPELRGFVARGDGTNQQAIAQSQVIIETQHGKDIGASEEEQLQYFQKQLQEIEENRWGAEPIQYIDELYGFSRETNGYLKLHYQRKTYELFISEDPRISMTDQQFRDAGNAFFVPYDWSISDVAYLPDDDYIPPKPATLEPPEDFVFRGWATDPSGTTFIKDLTLSTGEYTHYPTTTMPDYNVTVYAIWDVPRLITYNLHGGKVGETTDTITTKEFDGKKLTTPLPAREGYVFMGWKLADTDKTYDAGDTFRVDGDMTFDATWNKLPELEAKDTEIWQGDTTFDLKSMITKAEDEEDGDLKADVIIKDDGGFDANQLGTYTITFQVKDKQSGVLVTAKATVKVNMKAATINEAPTLELKDATILEGTPFDVKSLIVKAEDKEDGDLKDKVSLTDNGGMDTEDPKPGRYTLTFEVKDSQGAKTTKKATVTVVPVKQITPQHKPSHHNSVQHKQHRVVSSVLPQTGDTAAFAIPVFVTAAILIGWAIKLKSKDGTQEQE